MEENLNGNENLQDSGQTENNNSDFFIPDEYKEEGWTKVFDGKTGEELKKELFKSYDNSQKLIGKKVEDYIASTDLKALNNYEEIKEALQKQISPGSIIPEDIKEYNLNNILNEENAQNLMIEENTLDFFGNKFKELGLSADMGQKLFKTYIEHGIEEFRKLTDADELENNVSNMFKNDKGQRTKVESLIKEFLPKEDLAIIQESVPNRIIEMFYKVGKGLLDKYDYKESGINSSGSASMRMSDADRDKEYNRLANKLAELSSNPYQKTGDREKIIEEMRKLFE